MTRETINFDYELQPIEKSVCDSSILEVILYYFAILYKKCIN